ncbi:MAG: hypothetical protein HZA54_06025 [Planctomycetes bacterium]|nr:hypothetical protein [Planctomycetota bacterium]
MKWRDPHEAVRRLYAIAEAQAGYFTAAQALEAGYSRRLQHYHVHRGHWWRIERAIYRLREFPSQPHEDLVRWTLWSRGAGVISHETAAAVHELGDFMPARVHLTVPTAFRKRAAPGVVLHRGQVPLGDFRTAMGFTVTTPLRTFLDLVSSATEEEYLIGYLAEALERGALLASDVAERGARLDPESRGRAERVVQAAREAAHAV